MVVYLAAISIRAVAQDASSPKPTTPAAQVQLGKKYLAQKDYLNAMIWYRQAAEKGNAPAQNDVGWLYQNGWGVKQDYAEAATWYRKAADQGNATAQCNLGWLYRKGFGVNQDYSEAMTWFRKAGNQGDVKAQTNIGWLYEKGFGVNQDYAEAMIWYRKAADQNDSDAQNNIGWLYEKGLGVKQDYSQALTLYLQVANRGDAKAQTTVGWFYETGRGVKRDYGEAMAWFYRAAEKGNAQAQNNLGWLYENGLGVLPDDAKALTWYRKAADQGHAQAKGNIGRLSPSGAPDTLETKQNQAPPPVISEKGSVPTVVLPNGIHAPREIYSAEPEYSEQARKAMLTGTVLLSMFVDAAGQPRDLKVLTPIGSGLDEKAVDAIKKWKFEPATKDGTPVAVQLMVQVNFRLYGSGVGKVEIVNGPEGANIDSYLSPYMSKASACWTKLTEDKTYTPSIKQGQVTVQFAITRDGRVGATEMASSSGDDRLDRGARECVSTPKPVAALPVAFRGNELLVQMQFLYNGGVSLVPVRPQLLRGGRKQFHIEVAGIASEAAEWSVTGAGCTELACGTVSSDGLYTAPEVVPDPPFVRVKGTLAGANPVPASAVVTLVGEN